MIFASLGTMNIAFERMAKAVDEWAAMTNEKVIVQLDIRIIPINMRKLFGFVQKSR